MYELQNIATGETASIGVGRYVIGRDQAQCQIFLDEPFISRLQAAIEVSINGQAAIKNLSNKMTTFVNGQVIDVVMLKDGDRIDMGAGQTLSFIFRFERVAQQANEAHFDFGSVPRQPVQGDQTVFGDTVDDATSVFRVAVSATLRIGRAPDNDVVLDAPSVSRYHAQLHYDTSPQPVMTDLGSSNGTFINGNALRGGYLLQPSDWVTIGGYLIQVNGREVQKKDLSASRIVAYNVSKSYGEKTVVNGVSVALYPREFVGLMGASGCGKSTLMDALNGMRPATGGQVFINDLDLYQHFDLLRRSIGYVPQRDILHEALTVERTLYFAARMRLPAGTNAQQINEIINEVINTVGLDEQRHNAFRQLSGGQQKRLSLGIELITKPNFLFLDEPTSPLDPETTENMMLLFRRLADEGRIVIMVTHKFEKFKSMHNIVLLTKGGRLAYFGPPLEALEYFNCQDPSEIYRRLHERTPEESSKAFQQSPQFQKYVAKRFSEIQSQAGGPPIGAGIDNTGADRKPGIGQWLTLTQRLLEIKLKDIKNTLILLAQAPIVAIILAAITSATPNDARTIFIAAVIAIWLGANNAIREIVSESEVYERERLVNLKIPSYVLSKFAILSGIGLIQCVLFVSILTVTGKFEAEDFGKITLILYMTLLAGASIGLFFSALVKSTEKAMSILPLILIPQLLLSGFLKPIDDLYTNVSQERAAMVSEFDKWKRFDKKSIDNWKLNPAKPDERPPIPPDIVTKSEGFGTPAKFLSALMTARWTIDALAHQTSIIADNDERGKIASQMTVVGYQNVLDKGGHEKDNKDGPKVLAKEDEQYIVDGYRNRVRKDLIIQAFFSLIFLGLTMGALKKKDNL